MMLRRNGFSLIELLVVIGIISVLAAILAPVVIGAKESAQKAKCQSNLSQIGRAFGSYLNDYDSCYPSAVTVPNNPDDRQYLWSGAFWREPLRKYLAVVGASAGGNKQMVLACPSDPTPPGIFGGTSYVYSACFYMSPSQINTIVDPNQMRWGFRGKFPLLPCSTIKTSMINRPSKKVLATEYWTMHSDNPKVGWYDDPSTGNDPWSGDRNYFFADGHVINLSTRKIRPAQSPVVTRTRILPDINLTTNGVAGTDID